MNLVCPVCMYVASSAILNVSRSFPPITQALLYRVCVLLPFNITDNGVLDPSPSMVTPSTSTDNGTDIESRFIIQEEYVHDPVLCAILTTRVVHEYETTYQCI